MSDHYSQVQRQRRPRARGALVGRNLRDGHNVLMKRGSCVVMAVRERGVMNKQRVGKAGKWRRRPPGTFFSYIQDPLARTAAS